MRRSKSDSFNVAPLRTETPVDIDPIANELARQDFAQRLAAYRTANPYRYDPKDVQLGIADTLRPYMAAFMPQQRLPIQSGSPIGMRARMPMSVNFLRELLGM